MINWKIPSKILPPNKDHRCIAFLYDSESFVTAYFNACSGWHDYNDHRIDCVKYWIDEYELFDTLKEDK